MSNKVTIQGPVGRLEGELWLPEGGATPVAAAVVCHPHPLHGGTMKNNVVHRTARGLNDAGLAVTSRSTERSYEPSIESPADSASPRIPRSRAVLPEMLSTLMAAEPPSDVSTRIMPSPSSFRRASTSRPRLLISFITS